MFEAASKWLQNAVNHVLKGVTAIEATRMFWPSSFANAPKSALLAN
jgi:hypothetical protein